MVALGTATHVACPAATDKSLPRQFSFSRRRSRVQILVAITIAVTASSVFVFRVKLDTEEEVVTSQEGLLERQGQWKGGILSIYILVNFFGKTIGSLKREKVETGAELFQL